MSNQIAARNAKFATAVSELLLACAAHNPPHDPVDLLEEATAEHIPLKAGLDGIEPGKGVTERKEDFEFYRAHPEHRPSIARIIDELREEEEYVDQIVEGGHRVEDAREAKYGGLLVGPTFFPRRTEPGLMPVVCIMQASSRQTSRLSCGRHCTRSSPSPSFTRTKPQRSTTSIAVTT